MKALAFEDRKPPSIVQIETIYRKSEAKPKSASAQIDSNRSNSFFT